MYVVVVFSRIATIQLSIASHIPWPHCFIDAPNTYICIYATECNIQILIQFARVRAKRGI